MSSQHASRARALTTSEAVLWRTESPGLRLPILVMVSLDATPDRDRLCQALEHAARTHPELRSHLAEGPLAVGRPRWTPVPDLDVRRHLRVIRHPKPDDVDQVLDLTRSLAETPFDPARPLWECLLLQGPGAGGSVLVFRVHHALADGRLIVRMLDTLCADDDGADAEQPRLRVVPPPCDTGQRLLGSVPLLPMFAGAVLDGARRAACATARRLLDPLAPLPGALRAVPAAVRSGAAALMLPAPHSPALKGRSTQRELRIVDLPRTSLREAGRLVGGSTQDAFLTGVLGGLHHYHQAVGTTWPSVPMAVAAALPDGSGHRNGGNRFTGVRLAGPAGEPDPLRRLRAVHHAVRAARSGPLIDPDRLGPFSVLLAAAPGPAVRVLARQLTASDVHCTYVPGPGDRVRLAGVAVTAIRPFAPAVNCGFSVAMCSYDKTCAIGVNIDTEAVQHPDLLHSALVTGLREMTGLVDD
ncbi:wax ester/triacylglycerol synthase domain-containing protein [Streptomyces sp. SudanB182_2057]|uniref:wax ester/triacylglycerol synthase domain-containing protein n=1 Tax=Streptomyces sp. SudanB182_2057 TaxID=3035281 RepID=UPI003F57BE7C